MEAAFSKISTLRDEYKRSLCKSSFRSRTSQVSVIQPLNIIIKISFSGTVIFPVAQLNNQGDFQLKLFLAPWYRDDEQLLDYSRLYYHLL